jgi:cell wall-associated protease
MLKTFSKHLLSIVVISFIFLSQSLYAQNPGPEPIPKNWFLLDQIEDGHPGVSSEKARKQLLKNKKGETVIVAIIDSGVDYLHEDLNGVMWNNSGEIPDNKIDDDNNGYIDDVYGWNFLGGPDGRSIKGETYEVTRLYAKYRKIYADADPEKLSKKEKAEYEKYLAYKEEVETNQKSAESALSGFLETMGQITGSLIALENAFQEKEFNRENVMALETADNKDLAMAKNIAMQALSSGTEIESVADLRKMVVTQFGDVMRHYKNQSEISYNPDYDPRHVVGDNYADSYERFYGNHDAKGPDSFHGTHVAGIVASQRGNDIGMDGIADNVLIMSVRAVPDGDERDKDVANAILYAVDNGASIINMSFGKGHSWDKQVVDDAVRYAAKHDVLLIHAAGNSAQDNDNTPNFPNARYEKSGFLKPKSAKNWIEVGALAPMLNENAAARFSNYGKKTVDIFAPGVQIYSTAPENKYDMASGTSMAAPAVAGVAALIRSHYPSLTAVQVKDIIMKSAVPVKTKVKKPGTDELVDFKELCVTGGYINTYEALKLASKTKGKKKTKAKRA